MRHICASTPAGTSKTSISRAEGFQQAWSKMCKRRVFFAPSSMPTISVARRQGQLLCPSQCSHCWWNSRLLTLVDFLKDPVDLTLRQMCSVFKDRSFFPSRCAWIHPPKAGALVQILLCLRLRRIELHSRQIAPRLVAGDGRCPHHRPAWCVFPAFPKGHLCHCGRAQNKGP